MAQAFWCGFTDNLTPGDDYVESSILYWGKISASVYDVGNMLILTPNVTTIPGSSQTSNDCDGAYVGDGIIAQNGGSINGNIKWGILSPASSSLPIATNSYYVYGSVDIDQWYTDKGSEQNQFPGVNGHIKYNPFEAFYTTLNNPQNITRTEGFNSPNILPTDNTIYTAIKINEVGAPLFYQTSNTSGNLSTLLSILYPPVGEGGMPSAWGGSITSTMTDEQAAGVWLASGYPLYLGDDFAFSETI
jgi:hypothetical protein